MWIGRSFQDSSVVKTTVSLDDDSENKNKVNLQSLGWFPFGSIE